MTLHIIILLTFLTHVGFTGSRVTISLLAVDQGATPFVVGTIISLYAFIPALLALPAGRMIDRLGFKWPLLLGTSGVFVALLLPFLWPALPTLYAAASLLGISFMSLQIAAQTLAGAIAKPADRAHNFSLVSLGFGIANFVGPLLAGILIDHIGHPRTFLVLALPLIPAIVITSLGSRWIPNVHAKAESAGGGVFDLLKIRPLRNALIASSIVSSAWDLYQFFMPIYGRSLGLSATAIGLVLSAFAIAIVLVRVVLPVAVRHASPAQLLTYAMFVSCGAYCLFPFFQSAWMLAAASFVLGLGCGCGQPLSLTLVYNASPKGRAGEAAGMRITANQIAHFLIPLMFGGLGSAVGMTAVFVTNAACLAVGGVISRRNHAAVSISKPDA